MDSSGYKDRTFNPNERLVGGTHGLYFIFFLLEHVTTVVPGLCVLPALAITWATDSGVFFFLATTLTIPVLAVVTFAATLVLQSHQLDPEGKCDWSKYIKIKDDKLRAKYEGVKIPMEVFVEAYINQKVEIIVEPMELFWHRNEVFRFAITPGHFKFFLAKFVGQTLLHSKNADTAEVRDVYDRGNDFYEWFLGERMVYTSGIFEDPNMETLTQAQDRKMELVCRKTRMKPGDEHLDVGCGWGTLCSYAAKYFGTKSTGVTLAREQVEYGRKVAKENYGVEEHVKLLCMDYRDIPRKQYNVITCLEMAEHVGIKNFQSFLLQMRDMLTDDGIFYLQIAGLRRAWQFEDLIWGLFMATYIFPAADASCPLGFVVTQCERAGFEVHSVENCGVHYAVTINHWLKNWISNKEKVVAKYGEWWYRLWIVFLSWSICIASQGSSTVFLITLHKNTSRFERRDNFIGPYPIATQQ